MNESPFNPLVMIPVCNHGPALEGFLPRVLSHGIPVLLVDDGSDADTASILDRLEARSDLVSLHRHSENMGKGAAILNAARLALSDGYTHMLQIDADGQHNADDIPEFLNAARQQPEALVLACPLYGDDVDKVRMYSRYLTHVWVWIETLSTDIRDTMVGFRVYPLAATVALAERVTIGLRMQFDTEIAVRLFWDGLPVINIETPVRYIDGGHSNFDLVRDNVRITWGHIRLVFGMLIRLPVLLAGKFRTNGHPR